MRIVLGAAILAVGLGLFIWLIILQPEPERRPDDPVRAEVLVFRASPVEVARQWRGFGTARAMDAANVPARVTATVQRIPGDIDPGMPVEQGQLIAELDGSDFRQELNAARSRIDEIDALIEQLQAQQARLEQARELEAQDVETARRQYERAEELFEQEVIAEQDLDGAQRELIAAQRALVSTEEALDQGPGRLAQLNAQRSAQQAAAEQAQLNLERTTIRSPIAGVLDALDLEPGENIAAGQRVARVVSLQRIEIPLHLPASARAGIDIDDQALLRATDASARQWTASVARIAPADDMDSRTVRAYVELNQDPWAVDASQQRGALLNPGAFIEGRIRSNDRQQRWVVPRRAIRDNAIRVVEDGQVRSIPVQIDWAFEGEVDGLGLEGDRQWAVLAEDLSPGVLVMVDAAAAVLDGQRVQPVKVESLDGPATPQEVAP